MQITDKHVNFVIAFATFSGILYFTGSLLFAVVGFFGMLKGMKKAKEMHETWNEESVDVSKTTN